MSFRATIPDELVTHTIAMCGRRGERWLDELTAVIRELESQWSVTVGDPFPAIEFNYVAGATGKNDQPLVIKIGPPFDDTEIFSEAKFLKVLNGRRTIKLLALDRVRRSILLERAIPGQNLAELFTGNELGAIGPAIEVLQVITHKPPQDLTDTISLDDWFDGLRRYSETDFPKNYAEKALEIYGDLSVKGSYRYLHGDFHPGNVVSATRERFLAIDPKGIVGPIGYDIAVFLNNFHWWQEERADIKERLDQAVRKFAESFDIDEYDLRCWAFAQMVLGAWWTFDEMPDIYQNEVAKADVWDI